MRQRPPKGLSGNRVLLTLAALAGIFAGGLYWIAASQTPDEYRQSKPGAPADPVRVAAVDMRWQADIESVAQALRQASPDVVLVQHITQEALAQFAPALGMTGADRMFYSPLDINGKTARGCGILSRRRLFRQRELRDSVGETFAVAAETIVAGRRFLLVSAAIGGPNMLEQSEGLRKTTGLLRVGAVVCGGQIGSTATRTLRSVARPNGADIYASEHWKTLAGGGSGNVVWVELAAAVPQQTEQPR